jgi:hypothetical protein
MSAILDIIAGTKILAEEREEREKARIETERAERQTEAETEEQPKLEGEDDNE